jgi:hypothetical protein
MIRGDDSKILRWMRPSRRLSIAIHEAGHVAVALERDIRVDYVTIVPQTMDGIESGGHVHVPSQDLSFHDELLFRWAGICAEKLLRPKRLSWSALIHCNWDGDMAAIAEAARIHTTLMPRHPVDFTQKGYTKAATEILRRRWSDVLAIADALLIRNTLTREEIQTVLAVPRVSRMVG